VICTLLRKPLTGGGILNVLPCACLNIEASRVGTETIQQRLAVRSDGSCGIGGKGVGILQKASGVVTETVGRYPANIVLMSGFESLFPLSGSVGTLRLNTGVNRVAISLTAHNSRQPNRTPSVCTYGDTGSAARFFKSFVP
jgi:hypothetical protein